MAHRLLAPALLCSMTLALVTPAAAQFGHRRGRPGPSPSTPTTPATPAETTPAPGNAGPGDRRYGFTFFDARAAVERGEARPALAFYESFAADAEQRGARADAGAAYACVAFVAVRLHQLQKAITSAQKALDLLRNEPTVTGDQMGMMVSVYSVLGNAYRNAGDRAQARKLYEEGLTYARAAVSPHRRGAAMWVAGMLRQLAQIDFQEHAYADARDHVREAVTLAEHFLGSVTGRAGPGAIENARRQAAQGLTLLAKAELALDDKDAAEAALKRAGQYSRLVGLVEVDLDIRTTSAQVALARNDPSAALAETQRALTEAERIGRVGNLVQLYQLQARSYAAGRREGPRPGPRAGGREGEGQIRTGGALRVAGNHGIRRSLMARVVMALFALLIVAGVALAQSTETVGMITEIKTGRGRVEVRSTADWRRAGPLQALRAGDAVRATDDAVAVVMLSGGGTVKIEATNSPFTVAARADDTRTQKARTLVQAGLGFLAAGQRESPTAVLSTRSATKPPVVIAPRNTNVLPGPLVLEWAGSRFARYTVRIVGPSGPVFERRGVAGGRLDYPADAPALTPKTRYTIQVASGEATPQDAWFEVLDAERARVITDDLAALTQSFAGGTSRKSAAVVRAGMLASAGLLNDARRVVLDALASDPDEPALHQVLGNLYQKSGLGELAAESYDEAQFLLTRNAK